MSVQAVVTAPVSSVRLTVDNWAVVQSLMVQVQGFIEVLISKICSASAPISISHGLQSLTTFAPAADRTAQVAAADRHIVALAIVSSASSDTCHDTHIPRLSYYTSRCLTRCVSTTQRLL